MENKHTLEVTYDDAIVKKFTIATVIWGFVAFLVGIIVALQLADWRFNFDLPWISFGRLRPLHTNAAIFAFGGNAIFAGAYYSMQRLLKTRMFSDGLSNFHFWGWQLIIVAAALTLPFGITTSKEYAELEWPIDLAIAVVWVAWGINMLLTIKNRKEQHIYVAIWFYIATFVTVAILHVVNSISLPVSFLKSYPVYAGVQDALVQWWYGHNAVAFFLTTPFLGLMYYFIPKAANRPVYSYRLSIIHFWSLVFIYIWAGPHHLLNTALPNWTQTLGMIFSVMLWAPSWGGMINGLLTLRGCWDRLRTEPILKFLALGVTFYGMSTFEGPMLSIKSVNALAHYTDWIIAHVHAGALGWNGLISFGVIYYLVPKLWRTELFSQKLANYHFWLATIGILLYVFAIYTAGLTQGLMLQAVDTSGNLAYPDFVETAMRIVPLYWVRAFAGLVFLAGYVLLIVNVWKTIASSQSSADETVKVTSSLMTKEEVMKGSFHRILEGMPMGFTALTTLAVIVASVFSLVPSFLQPTFYETLPMIRPYTALELMGRDIYVKEGCYVCHSQMIRTLPGDVLRYGEASKMEESIYDRPFQWGSRRTGPDLARVGKKYPNLWHYRHMIDPREVTPRSLMPSYPWLSKNKLEFDAVPKKLQAMKTLGVPYKDDQILHAAKDAEAQAMAIASELKAQGSPSGLENKEIVALIAYLQGLGQLKTGDAK